MKNRKLLVLDIDGTLTNTTDKVLVECSATSGINKGRASR